MEAFLQRVDCLCSASFSRDFQLGIVHIHSNGSCPGQHGCASNRAQPDHAATKDKHRVIAGDPAPLHCMETHAQRLDERVLWKAELFRFCELLPRYRKKLRKCTVALDSKCLVVPAGVHATAAAGRTLTTCCVREHCRQHAHLKMLGHA